MAGMTRRSLRLSMTADLEDDDDDDGDLLELSVPLTTLGSRRRAVDASDLRQCALVQTRIKSTTRSSTYTAYRYGPVYHALNIYLCQAKSITRFEERYTESKFSTSGVWDKVPE